MVIVSLSYKNNLTVCRMTKWMLHEGCNCVTPVTWDSSDLSSGARRANSETLPCPLSFMSLSGAVCLTRLPAPLAAFQLGENTSIILCTLDKSHMHADTEVTSSLGKNFFSFSIIDWWEIAFRRSFVLTLSANSIHHFSSHRKRKRRNIFWISLDRFVSIQWWSTGNNISLHLQTLSIYFTDQDKLPSVSLPVDTCCQISAFPSSFNYTQQHVCALWSNPSVDINPSRAWQQTFRCNSFLVASITSFNAADTWLGGALEVGSLFPLILSASSSSAGTSAF